MRAADGRLNRHRVWPRPDVPDGPAGGISIRPPPHAGIRPPWAGGRQARRLRCIAYVWRSSRVDATVPAVVVFQWPSSLVQPRPALQFKKIFTHGRRRRVFPRRKIIVAIGILPDGHQEQKVTMTKSMRMRKIENCQSRSNRVWGGSGGGWKFCYFGAWVPTTRCGWSRPAGDTQPPPIGRRSEGKPGRGESRLIKAHQG